MTVGEKIKSIRKIKKISQQELGNMLGVSQAMIAQYENGKRIPKIETLIKIAEALDCEVSDINENIIVHRHTVRFEPAPENIEQYKKNSEAEKLIQKKLWVKLFRRVIKKKLMIISNIKVRFFLVFVKALKNFQM